MDKDKKLNRLKVLNERHKKLSEVVEALEAEKAPEIAIKKQKIIKLSIKDEITQLKKEIETGEALQ